MRSEPGVCDTKIPISDILLYHSACIMCIIPSTFIISASALREIILIHKGYFVILKKHFLHWCLIFMNEVFSRSNKMGVAPNNELTREVNTSTVCPSQGSEHGMMNINFYIFRNPQTDNNNIVCAGGLGANFHDFHRLKSGPKQVYSVGH